MVKTNELKVFTIKYDIYIYQTSDIRYQTYLKFDRFFWLSWFTSGYDVKRTFAFSCYYWHFESWHIFFMFVFRVIVNLTLVFSCCYWQFESWHIFSLYWLVLGMTLKGFGNNGLSKKGIFVKWSFLIRTYMIVNEEALKI